MESDLFFVRMNIHVHSARVRAKVQEHHREAALEQPFPVPLGHPFFHHPGIHHPAVDIIVLVPAVRPVERRTGNAAGHPEALRLPVHLHQIPVFRKLVYRQHRLFHAAIPRGGENRPAVIDHLEPDPGIHHRQFRNQIDDPGAFCAV